MADRASDLLDHLVSTRTRDLAADMVAVMIDTPGALVERLDERIEAFDEETLAALNDVLPLQSLSLMELSLCVAESGTNLARAKAFKLAPETVPERHEAILSNLAVRVTTLGIRLSKLGRREEALAASQEALDIYRHLAATRPDAFLPDLPRSLNNLGVELSNLGRREEALVALQEAVDIYRRLAQSCSDAFLPDLARSLGVLGQALVQAERHADAANALHEGMETIAPFVKRHAQAFGDLALTLGRIYIAACEEAGAAPDAALLERVTKALGGPR